MKTLKVSIFTIVSIISFLFIFQNLSLAQSPESFNLPVQLTLPGNPTYQFKRLKEKVNIIFKFSKQSKFSYRQELLEKRLSELVSLVEAKNANEIANSSQRFAYQAGVLAENSYKANKEERELIISLFEKYKPILEKMRDNFPANSPFWLLAQQDIDTLNILSGRLK